jgi:hypothetical protein
VQKYILKASRVLAAGKLSDLLNHVVTDPNLIEARRHLPLFAYSCFSVSARGEVNKLLSDYLTVDHQSLTATSAPILSRKKKKAVNVSVMQNLVEQNWRKFIGTAALPR